MNLLKNAGIGGNTSVEMVARLGTDVLPYMPGAVTVLGGTNNLNARPIALAADLSAIYDAVTSAGGRVIACTITPRTDLNAEYQAIITDTNDWIKANYSRWPRALLCDWNPVLTPDGLPGGVADPQWLKPSDVVHPNPAGEARMAAVLAPVLAQIPLS